MYNNYIDFYRFHMNSYILFYMNIFIINIHYGLNFKQ